LTELRCPECGREFDPAQPLSVNLGRPLDAFARAALRPIGRLWRAASWTLAVGGVVGLGWLLLEKDLVSLWLLLWLAFFVLCWLRSFARFAAVRLYRQPRGLLRVDDRFRRTVRVTFAVSTLLVFTRLPFLLTVLASRPWLDGYAYHVWAEIPATSPEPQDRVVCGLVIVEGVAARGDYVTVGFYGGGGVSYVRTDDGQGLRLEWWSWIPWWHW
jgi:hypothetical protein